MRSALCLLLVCAFVGAARADAPPGDAPPPLTEQLVTPQSPVDPPADRPKVGWAVFAGAATAIVPMAIGGAFFASTFNTTERRDATLGMLTGLALAPIVSHLVVREWSRAAIFGAIPTAALIGTAVLLELSPTANLYGTKGERLSFGLLLAFSTLSSGLGIADTYAAGARADAKRRQASIPVLPLPFATRGGGGLILGGLF